MDGNVIFNYSTLQVSKGTTKAAKHLIDSTNILNRTFVTFIHTVTKKRTPEVRSLYLNSFLAVVKGLRKSLTALEESLKEEFSDLDVTNRWEKVLSDDFNTQTATEADMDLNIADKRGLFDLQKLAAEHLMDEDSNPKCVTEGKPAQDFTGENMDYRGAQEVHPKLSESSVNMTKKLVVKLTPVTMNRELAADALKKTDRSEKPGEMSQLEDKETLLSNTDCKPHSDKPSVSLHVEESGARRFPRLKITPLRRPSDIKAKTSVSTANSDSDSYQEESSSTTPAENSEVQSLTGIRDNSDSDEVPVALLDRAALAQSSDEPQSEEDGEKVPAKVAKKCVLWVNKSSSMSPDKMRRKRKLLDSSPRLLSGNRRVKARRESGIESSSDEQDSQENVHCLRKTPHVKRGEKDAGRTQAGTSKEEAGQETPESSSSSEDVRDDDDASSDDQKMKPITEDVALMGAAAFHQSSGEAEMMFSFNKITKYIYNYKSDLFVFLICVFWVDDEEPSQSGPLWTAEEDDDPENRYASKSLDVGIKKPPKCRRKAAPSKSSPCVISHSLRINTRLSTPKRPKRSCSRAPDIKYVF